MGLLFDRAAMAMAQAASEPGARRQPRGGGDGAMKCPLCNAVHRRAAPPHGGSNGSGNTHGCASSSHGSRYQLSHNARTAFVGDPFTCPICLEVPAVQPMINLPCGHVVCQDDFQTLGGRIQLLDEPYNQVQEEKEEEEKARRRRAAAAAAAPQEPQPPANHNTNNHREDGNKPPDRQGNRRSTRNIISPTTTTTNQSTSSSSSEEEE
ncbi:hypothetical protein ACA910_008442 [Epithemia clementina (nom. ined.)]